MVHAEVDLKRMMLCCGASDLEWSEYGRLVGVHDVICSVRRAQKVDVLGLPRAPLWRQEGTLEGLEAIIAIE